MQCALVSSKIHSGLCSARYHAADYNQQSNCPSRNLPLCSCAAAPPIMSSSTPSTNPRMLRSGGGGGGLRTSFVVSDPQQLLQQFQSASEGLRSFSSRRGSVVAIPRAIAATATDVAEVVKEFTIDGNMKLFVKAAGAGLSSPATLEFQLSQGNVDSLLLHWGALQPGNKSWILPANRPAGTQECLGALQTPFTKSGDTAVVKVEITGSSLHSVEFLLLDKTSNHWFKLNGGNFCIDIPQPNLDLSRISVPEELVGIQAYLRWERNGKQNYSPEKEKVEFEEARKELQIEIARGVSIAALKARLLGAEVKETEVVEKGTGEVSESSQVQENTASTKEASKLQVQENTASTKEASKLPEDLIGIQAYVRWEKAGKPNFSPVQQLAEFEEARKDLELELKKGVTIEQLRKRFAAGGNGSTQQKSPKKQQRITRKKRDAEELINKFTLGTAVSQLPATVPPPRELTALESAAQTLENVDNGAVVIRKMLKVGGSDLLVLVTNAEGKVKVWVASDMKEPLILRWAVSKDRAQEWAPPPDTIIPVGSTLQDGTCDTPLKDGFAGVPSLQYVEILVGDNNFIGMPFVLRSGGNWYKDNGSDYYVPFQLPQKKKTAGDGKGTASAFLEEIANQESEAERSLMHRYNIATGLTQRAKDEGELALAGVLVWLRFMATRQLTWNKNYNVKPREISAAQDRLTELLQWMYRDQPQNREIIRLIMSTVGRGGEGDVGQRIRDEILVIQRNNDCAGGMMEEWHQKLHNNTSPDDVVICQALLDYIKSGFKMEVYWKTLNDNGVTKERMRSYDRPIVSEPKLRTDQKDGLIRDLTAYLRTLKAVHSGADLESAIQTCMGYTSKGMGFMGGVQIHPISGLSSALPDLLRFVLEHVEDKEVIPLLEGLLEARRELRPTLLKPHDRLRDIVFLDLALDSTVRTAVERGLESLTNAGPLELALIISMVVENLCLSSNNNEELVYCLKDWYHIINVIHDKSDNWALRTKAVLDRTRLALADKAEYYQRILQPTAEYLGGLLGIEQWAIDIFTEEMIRAGSAASLSQLLNRLDPVIRKEAHMGSWQVISPVDVRGFVEVVEELEHVQDKVYERPTILVSRRVKGEEEIPDGAIAVLTPDMPDVLSHVSVRARNSKVCFATCFDPNVLADLRSKDKKAIAIQITANADLVYSDIQDTEVSSGITVDESGPPPGIKLKKHKFAGKYAVSADSFTAELVGAKSRNIANLRGELPLWIHLPTSVALPFGVFEKVLSERVNKDVASEIAALSKQLHDGDFSKLKDARKAVLGLEAPLELIEELKSTMKASNMPWPGDEGEERWQQAWTAIKRVWGSKWNERAYFSTRKAKIDHSDLCMAVLVQEIICADYAFVIHTTNPSTGDDTEIYAEVVKGLGETLVGAYSGRALSFIAKKSNIKSPKVLGYPSKRAGLFIKQSIIFRSDSNGEDLEGYAGAGLYDSVPMDEEEERLVDYSTDHLILDEAFQKSILTKIAEAGYAVEKLLGSAQDIEGVIKDGELYIVQTRPQM